jgi:hypothetical protein
MALYNIIMIDSTQIPFLNGNRLGSSALANGRAALARCEIGDQEKLEHWRLAAEQQGMAGAS